MNKTILEHIRSGKVTEATSLVETILKSKIADVMEAEKMRVAATIYGPAVSEAVAPGGNNPGTNPTLKPKKTGLQNPEGQKQASSTQDLHQKRSTLQQQVADQRQKQIKAQKQALNTKDPSKRPASIADANVARAKKQAATAKLSIISRDKK